MKLNAAQLRSVEAQLGVDAISEGHPVSPDLKAAFGDHTYFLDTDGLNIIEQDPSPDSSSGIVVRMASWSSDERKELVGHAPQALSLTVDLGKDEPDPAT